MRRALALVVAVAAVGCGGGSNGVRASLDDVDPSGDFWAIRATCEGGSFGVEFLPGERLSVSEIAHASYEEISVDCGTPERIPITAEDGAPTAIDMTKPSSAAATLACFADGTLVVSVNPIWGPHATISGSSLRVERGGQAIVAGSLKRDAPAGNDHSRVSWSRAVCKRA